MARKELQLSALFLAGTWTLRYIYIYIDTDTSQAVVFCAATSVAA